MGYAFSALLLLANYSVVGFFLTINLPDNLTRALWIGAGALAFASGWAPALTWGLAAIVILFASNTNYLMLGLGSGVGWGFIMYFARLQVQAFLAGNKFGRFVLLALLAATGMGLGVLVDSPIGRTWFPMLQR
ncbi:MAG: hypothetical protein HC918_02070 [Oscillatoriales cyanobacterium SM2_1_8]|nr:hypothetical protein [Oscillatoriales cyanobacterium SM2_1_8]